MAKSLRTVSGSLVAMAFSLLCLAQESSNYQPTWFGVDDGQVPEDPRHFRGGRFYDFPDWKVSQDLPNDVFTFARLRYNSGTWMDNAPSG